MEKVINYFLSHKEDKYGDFISNLTPSVKRESIIGVRVPLIRSFVNVLSSEEKNEFLKCLPHKYYEETLLHGFIIQKIKKFDECIDEINRFLPHVNNWATCDTMSPKSFAKNADKVFLEVKKWIKSKHTYTVRFGIVTLMNFFIEKEFNPEHLKMVASIKSDEYYINIAIAWYFATALAKQYDDAIKIIESKSLGKWLQNKSIQKAIESNRISEEIKEYLKTLKII